MTELSPQPLSIPCEGVVVVVVVVEVMGSESSNPLIMWLVSLVTSPHPHVLSRSHLININSGVAERVSSDYQ